MTRTYCKNTPQNQHSRKKILSKNLKLSQKGDIIVKNENICTTLITRIPNDDIIYWGYFLPYVDILRKYL